ncbi:2-polyprenyl-6-methoxyphenol hydroxylase-like FAD-dependent oxidoreductase [Novosphingobium sp. SG751A]|uniref:FAD-dependent monooxygenase n=1 Tax=Novosphingobium sp. SG751A TaxID=2587000 RepID=UPI001555A88A|nr:FAD-dependent monooxygenase [Novosphingobium sp. SG751A]NOW48600.1 2-polyprenyl-6-methoxyphenol hydroxylase-like FAD-dependent oxidoreductase [Novosphingobium sp. SG751A]
MTICIIGGGVAGLALAIGLHQRGIACEVVERDKDWKVYHVGIIVQANFVRALNALGVGDAAVAAGYAYRGARFVDVNGNTIAELPGDTAVDGLPSDLGLTRPALHKVLTDKVKELGIPVRLGVTFTTMEDYGDHVELGFSDGTSGSYDLVVGADGNYSAVRKAIFPDAAPKFTGQGVWRYNVPRPEGLEWSDIYIGNGHNGFNGKAGYCPLTPDEMYIFAVVEEKGNPRFAPETLADEMRARLAGYGGILGEAAKAITDPALVVYRPLEACIMPDPWHKGRVVLIGDAAHSATPHLGQGAAMAVEDAVVLAQELGRGDIPAALRAFMERRFERAKLVGTFSIQLGEWEMHPESAGDPVEVTDRIRKKLAEPV